MGYLDNSGLTYLWSKIKSKSTTITLTVARWSNKSQTVNVTGVTASNLVLVSTNDLVNGIKCTAQGSGTLTFTCEVVPTANVTVSVSILS